MVAATRVSECMPSAAAVDYVAPRAPSALLPAAALTLVTGVALEPHKVIFFLEYIKGQGLHSSAAGRQGAAGEGGGDTKWRRGSAAWGFSGYRGRRRRAAATAVGRATVL